MRKYSNIMILMFVHNTFCVFQDLLTVNVGKILLECSGMLTAFQSYCVKQAGAALLLAGLEKDKELLRIFLRVSQMENTVLRRMNLNSFLMVSFLRYFHSLIILWDILQ